jgi:hypothetical protein
MNVHVSITLAIVFQFLRVFAITSTIMYGSSARATSSIMTHDSCQIVFILPSADLCRVNVVNVGVIPRDRPSACVCGVFFLVSVIKLSSFSDFMFVTWLQ